MKHLFGMAAVAALLAFAPARAEDTAQSLRQPAIDWCKGSIGDDAPPKGADATCTCMIDAIIVSFGDDAVKMLRILIANLNESDIAGIAKLLGISEAEAKAFVDMATLKIEPIQGKCMS
ncbi:hypothetical protein sos41_13700 [Alphaproteobacteria bacterium SO-S41]|nr:hypothetical protein sos41_13700 [Alphaproteobacteria bacterium SO-S41]